MPTKTQDTIFAAFNRALGGPTATPGASGTAVDIGAARTVPNVGGTGISSGMLPTSDQGLTDALAQAAQVINAQTQATSANTDALGQNSQAKQSSSAGSEVSGVLNTTSQLLGGGFSLMPLVSLFSSLFGGGQPQQPAPLTPYSMPSSLSLGSTPGGQAVNWGENGLPRAAGNGTTNTTQQVTVQVQALDSQSFLDHSDDIAQAVRQAMLNMNSLNDVVTNL